MPEERFPKKRYLRELRSMRNDFDRWQRAYRAAGSTTPVEWLAVKLSQRADTCEGLWHLTDQAVRALEDLPRTS